MKRNGAKNIDENATEEQQGKQARELAITQDSIANIAIKDLEHVNPTRKWFAEGIAAEQELADLKQSSPLPALYDRSTLDDAEPEGIRGWLTQKRIWVIAAGVGALLLIGILLISLF